MVGSALTREIDRLLGRRVSCECGREHPVLTRIARFDDHNANVLSTVLHDIAPAAQVLIVTDTVLHTAVAETVATTLSSHGFTVKVHVFNGTHRAPLIADEQRAVELVHAIDRAKPACVVGVGSGTINDLCKFATTDCNVPYVAYATAASMNGYTSTVASLKRNGLKVTDPVQPPVAIIVDPNVITRSPPAMTAAGVADLLSKSVCAADWLIAHQIRGTYYCDAPARVASLATDHVIDALDKIAANEADSLRILTQGLVLSGMSMAMAGSSSPASGAEHLVSHYWDMVCPSVKSPRLHGAQVGLGVLISAAVYEMLLSTDVNTIDPNFAAQQAAPWDEISAGIRSHFGHAANAVLEQARPKYLTPQQARERCVFIKEKWNALLATVRPVLTTHRRALAILKQAGAPTTLAELGLTSEQAVAALRWARWIRNRYTVFDLATEVGLFGDEQRDVVLTRSGVLG